MQENSRISRILPFVLPVLLAAAVGWAFHLPSRIWGFWSVTEEALRPWFPRFPWPAVVALVILPQLFLCVFLLWKIFPWWKRLSLRIGNAAMQVFFWLRANALAAAERTHEILKRVLTLRGGYPDELRRHLLFFLAYTAADICLWFLLPDAATRLSASRAWVVLIFLHLLAFAFINRHTLPSHIRNWMLEPGSATALAVFRIIIFWRLTGFYEFNLHENHHWAAMDASQRVSLPFMGWFIQNIPITPEGYAWACRIGLLCAWCCVFGFGTRFFGVLNIFIGIYVLGVPFFFGKLFHQHVWVWFPALLSLSRCSDTLSADALIRKHVRKLPAALPQDHSAYFLPLKFAWLLMGIIYFFAGVIKVWDCSWEWSLGDSMIQQMQLEWVQHYYDVPGFRLDHFPVLAKLAGTLLILFEVVYPFFLFSGRMRWIPAAGGIVFHNMALYFMHIGFQDLQYTYLGFVNWEKVKRWFTRAEAITKAEQPKPPDPSSRRVMAAGTILVSVIFLCSLFKVHSWPFSSYPTYSRLVPATHRFVHFEATDENGTALNVDSLGKVARFRKESYTPFEDRIADGLGEGDSVKVKRYVRTLWQTWQANVPALRNARSATAWLYTGYVSPERRGEVTEKILLGSMD